MDVTVEKATSYPWVIGNAVARVFDAEELRAMADSCRLLLVALVKKIEPENGRTSIYTRRETLAYEIGKSVETVYRGLRQLEAAKLIEAREQAKDDRGRLCDSVIVFSTRLCQLLALPLEKSPSATADRPYIEEQFINKKQSTEAFDSSKGKPQGRTTPRGQIPADLQELEQRSLSAPAIFQLMRIARENKHRLSDVLECVIQRVRDLGLQGQKLYAYLLTVLRKELDFAWMRKQKRVEVEEKSGVDAAAEKRKAASADLEGAWFESTINGARCVIERGVVAWFKPAAGRWKLAGSSPLSDQMLSRIEEGVLVPSDRLKPAEYI